MKNKMDREYELERPETGEQYMMDYEGIIDGWPSFFLYTGLKDCVEGREHEFVLTTTYMDIPCDGLLLTCYFPEGRLAVHLNTIDLDKSEFRQSTVHPRTPEHQRLNEILVKWWQEKKRKIK